MNELDNFIQLFGDITILQIVEFIIAGSFMIGIYKKVKTFFQQQTKNEIDRQTKEKVRDEQIKEALDSVHKYPEYRKQSIEIQQKLQSEINELKSIHKDVIKRLEKQEYDTKEREKNKIRDRLLQNYRYYTNKEANPSQSWTQMEADAFWDLFSEYEKAGGDGHMHSVVQPEMERLTVTTVTPIN